MKISLCSQVKNRRHQLEKTIKANIAAIKGIPNVEWVIVDMGSDDGVEDLIKENMTDEILYHRIIGDVPYSIPIAKNFSARLSTGDYVFNLDIDNFICGIVDKIRELDYQGVRCLTVQKGVFGRIGCMKETYRQVGGYDELFLPAAHHEQDFIGRCERVGFKFVNLEPETMPIQNDKKDTTKNMKVNLEWIVMNEINTQKKMANQKNNVINPNLRHATGLFLRNFKNFIELGQSF